MMAKQMKVSHVTRQKMFVALKVFHNGCERGGMKTYIAKTKKQL
jgi:hypothetical protein